MAALYQFATIAQPETLRAELARAGRALALRGTLLVATEGLNGTIAGTPPALDAMIARIRTVPGCEGITVKYSYAPDMPFSRFKVRLKREIVTMGVDGIDPNHIVGTYVPPADWNALISDPDTIVIDTRNDYEVEIGTFAQAIDPKTRTFREFPAWFRANRDALLAARGGKPPKVAMFCTGGIRCEKSTAFLKAEGVDEVYHLEGGILRYLEEMPASDSLWQGQCYVFDKRVSVGHALVPGDYAQCWGCGRPVSPQQRAAPEYEEGVCCPACHTERDETQKAALRARHAQALQAGTAYPTAGAPA